ncbi:hypothetical protein [Sulfobacillus harzensis]|uniref:Uncharacterized protein n=1 Tax=Sulfobacillus harzensis TaxID=2729629 RepID=A0A7Y0L2M8_9FIRM|nr:hypothetical protein [Sulfobacillus harzensis]NMP21877.1 hypothetical protein [Sulfobacillus harzensis]
MYRHGDVLLIPVNEVPADLHPKAGAVVAYGEVTGHAHRLLMDGLLYEAEDGTVYIRAPQDTAITHEEHGTIPLPAGLYRVSYQREYAPYEQAVRQVLD